MDRARRRKGDDDDDDDDDEEEEEKGTCDGRMFMWSSRTGQCVSPGSDAVKTSCQSTTVGVGWSSMLLLLLLL